MGEVLREDRRKLNIELEKIKNENRALRERSGKNDEFEVSSTTTSSEAKEIEKLKKMNSELHAECDEKQEKIENLQAKVERLQQEVKGLEREMSTRLSSS